MTNFLKNAISHDEKKSRNYFNSLLLKLKASSSFEKKTVGVKEKLRSINIKEERNDKTEILNVGRHYSKTRTVGTSTKVTEEIAGTPTSLDLVHLKVSRDFDVLVDAKGEKLRPISLSFDVSSDLRKNHRVAGETKIWAMNGSHLGSLVVADFAPFVGFGPPTGAFVWNQKWGQNFVTLCRYIQNKSLKQFVLQPVLKIGQCHEMSLMMQDTFRSHSDLGYMYKYIVKGSENMDRSIDFMCVQRSGKNKLHSEYCFKIEAKIGDLEL